ncbi:hypothetical protein BT96DRAFT_954828 [Gymnopus androsaceus JB14]|uniref:Uncharacterized protein n=1 Tax=Gymnopus androsaceus JB14 TaxID=1447944 RepID=A0A6A4I6W3_9AGAR|nr:hypothetical protein BT96DRAFT_954828 [Gymnopus androsaceus JB14]
MFLSIAKRRTAVASARWLSSTPWFVEQDAATSPNPHISHTYRAPPLPEDAPKVLVDLHSQLIKSPHLEQSNLLVTRALSREMGPPPPLRAPHGRRRKGGTFAIETAFDIPGSLWSWTVFAEVKEGTEKKGSIESVVRLVRKSLLTAQPPLPLPPNSKRRMQNGWAMIDAGEFAVHILSKGMREKYFNQSRVYY